MITALSNGAVEMRTAVLPWMPEWTELKLYPWLQEKDHLARLPEGKTFLLLTDRGDGAGLPFSRGSREVYRADGYVICEYAGAAALYGALAEKP